MLIEEGIFYIRKKLKDFKNKTYVIWKEQYISELLNRKI